MNNKESPLRNIARRLVAHAAGLLSDDRSEWALAMCHEIDHITNDKTAIRWAVGCVFACYIERMSVMKTGDFHISRLVLSLELLVCFGLNTIVFCSLFWPGVWLIPTTGLYLFLMSKFLIGPIGLIVAFRLIVLKRSSNRSVTISLLCIPAAWSLLGFIPYFHDIKWPGYEWPEFILLAILPALGVAHLVYMSNPEDKINRVRLD